MIGDREGRPPALTEKQLAQVEKDLKNVRFATTRKVGSKHGVAHSTIARSAKKLLKLQPVKVSYRILMSQKHRDNRIAWAEKRLTKDIEYWKKWVFSDEKWFYLVCKKTGEWIWVSEEYLETEGQPPRGG